MHNKYKKGVVTDNLAYIMQDMDKKPAATNNYFAVALRHYLGVEGRGAETALAIESGVAQPTINRIKKGFSYGLRSNCEKIAAALGTSYADMIMLGKQIANGEDIEADAEGQNLVKELINNHQLRNVIELLQYIRQNNPIEYGGLVGRIETTAEFIKKDQTSDRSDDKPG